MRFATYSFAAGLVAAVCAGFSLPSKAGFVVTGSLTSIDATLNRLDLFARNTGGDTGTELMAVEIFADVSSGVSLWRATNAGGWDVTNAGEAPNRSFIRIDASDPSNTSIANRDPSFPPADPQYGPNTIALADFSVAAASSSVPTAATEPPGALFAQLFVTKNFSAIFSGFLGGSAGPKAPWGFSLHGDPTGPVIENSGVSVDVVFGSTVSEGAPFSVTIHASDADGGDLLHLAAGALPPGISNLQISPATSGSPASFTVTGVVDYSLNGLTVVVPITVTDSFGLNATGNFLLVVTPEPASVGAVGACLLFVRRCRRAPRVL